MSQVPRMRNSTINTVLASNKQSIIVQRVATADALPMRVFLRVGSRFNFAFDPGALQNGGTGDFFTLPTALSSTVFILAPHQTLYAASTTIPGDAISGAISDAYPVPRKAGIGTNPRTYRVFIPELTSTSLPQLLATAPNDSAMRVTLDFVGLSIFVGTELDDLLFGRVSAFTTRPHDVFVLAPGQNLWGIQNVPGGRSISVFTTTYTDIYAR